MTLAWVIYLRPRTPFWIESPYFFSTVILMAYFHVVQTHYLCQVTSPAEFPFLLPNLFLWSIGTCHNVSFWNTVSAHYFHHLWRSTSCGWSSLRGTASAPAVLHGSHGSHTYIFHFCDRRLSRCTDFKAPNPKQGAAWAFLTCPPSFCYFPSA